MRKYLKYLLLISIFSCDKIESPLPEEYGKFDWSLYPGDPIDYSYDLVNPETNWGPNNNPKSILLEDYTCLLYTSPSPRDRQKSRMPSSA